MILIGLSTKAVDIILSGSFELGLVLMVWLGAYMLGFSSQKTP